MTKRCTICKVEKPLSEYNKHSKKKDGKQLHCRECNREHSRAYYSRNRELHKKNTMNRKNLVVSEHKQRIWDYKLGHPCVDCGEKDPVVLDFDHVRGEKIESLSVMVHLGSGWSKISKEIDKCEIRCSNCHRKKTSEQLGYFRGV